MGLFLLGAFSMWAVLALLILLCREAFVSTNSLCVWIVCAPILIPLYAITYICILLYCPWRNVVRPVPRKRFDAAKDEHFHRISDRFWICFEPKARLVNKLFFVRIEKEEKEKEEKKDGG